MSSCFAFAILANGMAATARACPMCKDGTAIAASPTTQPQVASAGLVDFNTSIYVMLGVVAVVGGTVVRAMVKAVRV